MEQKVFDVDNLINEIYNEFSWVFADNKKYIKLVNIIQKNINELQEEVERLKTELAEKDKQLQNAVFPKFKVGDMVYVIRKIKQDIRKGKIKSTWKGSHIDNFIRFKIYINGANDVTKQESELFATLAEAEEALKKLEEV